ncbi:MAG: Cupin 2 conserved barrel domain protein [Proteobacteria bacterium]|nr:Cupin 2 conserved barrel domain protein [Pseudomonadota bacterium]
MMIRAIVAAEATPRLKASLLPEPFATRISARIKRPLGDLFGLKSFGVNHVTIPPGAITSLFHRHSVQDEFVLVLTGTLVLVHDSGETVLEAGMCAGFPAGGTAHHLINRADEPATYLEIGDRQRGDTVEYPNDDLQLTMDDTGQWVASHKDGTPYA